MFKLATKDASSQLRLIAGLAIVTLLLLYVTAGLLNWWGYNDAREEAKRHLSTLDLLLAEETARTIDGVRIAVDGVAEDLASSRALGDDSFRETLVSQELRRSLNRIVLLLPQVAEIAVVPVVGDPVFSNRSASGTISADLLDTARDAQNSIVFTVPTIVDAGGSAPRTSLSIVRRIVTDEGDDLGAVVGVIPVEYFEELYRSLEIGAGGAVSLWWEDGTLLARDPEYSEIGRVSITVATHLTKDGKIAIVDGYGRGESLPGSRVMAIKTVRAYPLAVSTSYSLDVILVPWWRTLLYSFAGCIFLTLLAGLLVAAVGRQLDNAETIRRTAREYQKAIDERERIAGQLRQSQKLEVVGQLTAGIAHDFNNLLTVVMGNLEIVGRRLKKMNGDPVAEKSVASAMSGTKKAALLTHRLLAFARKQPLAPQSIDVKTMLEGLVELMRRSLGESVKVSIEPEEGIWPVYVDASQLENAMVNLAVNSRDAMPDGGRLTVSVKNVHVDSTASNILPGLVGDFVSIAVTDTGTGMSPDIAAKAFEPFFSTKEIGKGSGLGLSQIYGFAKQSGGDCTIESAVGEGTTVTIYIPRSEISPDTGAEQDVEKIVRGNGETVLVVDDTPEVRDYAVKALRELGYLVRQAESASDAMAILDHGGIDAMLTDLGLPGMAGNELAAEARRRNPDLAVVFMTGYADRFQGLRDFEVLEKPFPYSEVSRAMYRALRGEPV